MIQTKKQLKYYLSEDRKALQIPDFTFSLYIKNFLFPNVCWKFQKTLRYTEYYTNKKHINFFLGTIDIFLLFIYKWKLRRISQKLGFSIPCNVCGPGLSTAHYGTIIINENAKIGANCRLHACVNIGASGGGTKAPQIGDNVYIGPSVVIFGDIQLANNITIGANSTVNKSFNQEHIVIAGTPAKIVKENAPTWIEFNKIL